MSGLANEISSVYIDSDQKYRKRTSKILGDNIKSIKYSEFYFDGLGVNIKRTRHNVPLKLWKPLKRDSRGFPIFSKDLLNKLPIPVNGSDNGKSAAYYLGRYPLKVGKIPQTFRFIDQPTRNFLSSRYCPYYIKADESWVMVNGSWDTNRQHLVNMAKIDNTGKLGDSHLRRFLTEELQKIDIPILPKPLKCDIFSSQYNMDAQCGGDFSPFGDKNENWRTFCEAAYEIWDEVGSIPTPDHSIYICGGREKRSKDTARGENLASRLVLNQDPASAALGKAYTSKLEHWFKHNDSENNPFYIGHSNAHNGWLRYYADIIDAKSCLEGDWTSYDECPNAKILAFAFAMARSYFPDNDVEIDNHFFYFASGFISKHVVTPDGLLYKINKGIPSGNVWTSIIGSFVNYILLTDALRFYTRFCVDRPRYRLMICGDDFVVSFLDPQTFSPKMLAKWFKKRHGFILEKYKVGPAITENEEDSIKFLKTVIRPDGMPSISYDDLYPRMLLPNKRYTSAEDLFKFILSQGYCLPRTRKSIFFLCRYLAYCQEFLVYKRVPNFQFDCDNVKDYLSSVRRMASEIRRLKQLIVDWNRKVYFSSKHDKDSMDLIETGVDRWSFFNSSTLYDDVSKKYCRANVYNWIYDNFYSLNNSLASKAKQMLSENERKSYLSKIVGKRLSPEARQLFCDT